MDNNHRTTTLSYMGKPITVWIVGLLESLNVYVGKQKDNPTVRMCVRLLSNVDRLALADMERMVHRDHTTPPHQLFRAVSPGGERGRQVCAAVLGRISLTPFRY